MSLNYTNIHLYHKKMPSGRSSSSWALHYSPPRNRSYQEILHCFPSAPSGYYQIHAANGSAVQVYCDMERTNCGGEGGWMMVAYINMTHPNVTYPQGLSQKIFSKLTYVGGVMVDVW